MDLLLFFTLEDFFLSDLLAELLEVTDWLSSSDESELEFNVSLARLDFFLLLSLWGLERAEVSE